MPVVGTDLVAVERSGTAYQTTAAEIAGTLSAADIAVIRGNQIVGSGLGTTGTVNLDVTALSGTIQTITATGDLTFTTSNRVSGKSFELRIAAGAAARTLTWPAGWVSFSALPTALPANEFLTLAIRCLGTADANIDAAVATSPPAAGSGSVAWDDVTGKPTTFPPEAHSHVIADTTGLQTALDGKPNSDTTGVTGADAITNIMSLTQAEYDAIGTKNGSTLYVITP